MFAVAREYNEEENVYEFRKKKYKEFNLRRKKGLVEIAKRIARNKLKKTYPGCKNK